MEGSSTLITPFVLHAVAFHYYELSIGGSEVKLIVQLLTWTLPTLKPTVISLLYGYLKVDVLM